MKSSMCDAYHYVGKERSKKKLIEEYKVYSIEIKRKKERYYVHITYDIEEVQF